MEGPMSLHLFRCRLDGVLLAPQMMVSLLRLFFGPQNPEENAGFEPLTKNMGYNL